MLRRNSALSVFALGAIMLAGRHGAVSSAPAFAQGRAAAVAGRIELSVSETGGIRRSQFPVNARIPMAQGALPDGGAVRLRLNDMAVPVQPTPVSRWPDGSVRELELDFNASPGPNETQRYVLEYGNGVVADPSPGRGLTVADEGDAVQVGNVRFGKKASPIIASVKYRDEAIGISPNPATAPVSSIVLTDRDNTMYDSSQAQDVQFTILKRGPLVAAFRYTGTFRLQAGQPASFEILVEMPSSKSWIKITARAEQSERRIRSLAIYNRLAVGPLPLVWDFGTTRWTYGSLRTAETAVVMTSPSAASAASSWMVSLGPIRNEQPYEIAPAGSTFGGWGHFQGTKEVVAFAIERPPAPNVATRIALNGAGDAHFSLTPAEPTARHELVLYEHFVAPPVQIGAATSPAAILSPLRVVVSR